MDWSYLPCGIVIGLSVAAPIGPMALLCIRRTLAHGRVVGLVSGVGVATADAVYGAVAAFGLTSISSFLVDIQDTMRLGGGRGERVGSSAGGRRLCGICALVVGPDDRYREVAFLANSGTTDSHQPDMRVCDPRFRRARNPERDSIGSRR